MPPIPARHKSTGGLLSFARNEQERLSKAGMARRAVLCVFATVVCLAVVFRDSVMVSCGWGSGHKGLHVDVDDDLCPQPPSLVPSTKTNAEAWSALVPLDNGTYASHAFYDRAINWLGGAVRIPTECFDGQKPVGEDSRWEVFAPLHDYLLTAFPLLHSTLKLTKVNTYGLVYVWEGADRALKPLLLAAHQDVVPVNPETVSSWTYPPYSGYFDGKRLWSRGSSDDKSGLVGILASIESLLELSYVPKRSVVVAFGFDEEASGTYGATTIGKYLLETYGKNAFAMLVDEGGDYMDEFGSHFATVGTGEKGFFNTRVDLNAPGGHSSVPPPHTTIGMLSSVLVALEDNPYEPHLGRGTPMYSKALCLAAHTPALPIKTRRALKKAARNKDDASLRRAEALLFAPETDPSGRFRALVGTTQAADLISGGVKANALPESAWAVVNHRIATDGSSAEIVEHETGVLREVAERFNLTLKAFGEDVIGGVGYGRLEVSAAAGPLEPAPITRTEGEEAEPWRILAGTARATHRVHWNVTGRDKFVVSPGIMSGNTDTAHYWDLTEHIFRYNHHYTGSISWLAEGAHTINESISVDAWLEMIRFFTTLILNVDEAAI